MNEHPDKLKQDPDPLHAAGARPFSRLGEEVKLDTDRLERTGFSEIIYCPGKSDEQLRTIARALRTGSASAEDAGNVLFSRITPAQHAEIAAELPEAVHHASARLTGLRRRPSEHYTGVAVISAGSSDVPVAEEAALTAEYMGCDTARLYDVGVAGLHRLLAHLDVLRSARAIVAVAGMEGALPTVLADRLLRTGAHCASASAKLRSGGGSRHANGAVDPAVRRLKTIGGCRSLARLHKQARCRTIRQRKAVFGRKKRWNAWA